MTDIVQMERQVHEAQKLKTIGLLAGGVAHDFNNQLTSIMGNAGLLQARLKGDAFVSKFVERIMVSARRSADITAQLLAFARKGKYNKVAVDLHSLIHEVVTLLRESIDKHIEIDLRLLAAPSQTMGDPSQLHSAILNLALNARDAIPESGTITFTTELVRKEEIVDRLPDLAASPAELFVQVSVCDDGTGIDDEVRQRMFEPFFTTKEVGRGTGLGLAAVYGTIQSHHGGISVASQPGKGTAVHVYLPAYTGNIEPATLPQSSMQPVRGAGTVLVVDDEPLVLETTAPILESLGYRATLCSSGNEALELFREKVQDFDVVILDLLMPQMSGLEVLREMRKIDPQARIILASGYPKSSQVAVGHEIEPEAFLQKPFDIDELSHMLSGALTSRGRPSSVTPRSRPTRSHRSDA